MLLIAVAITAYQRGSTTAYQRGFREGVIHGENQRSLVGTTYAKAYKVADLVKFDPRAESDLTYANELMRELCNDVLPRTWQDQGGAAALSGYARNGMIVISHDQDGHQRIAEYLNQRRENRAIAKN
jgi:hypothetical protein